MTNPKVRGSHKIKDWKEGEDLWDHKTPPNDPKLTRLIAAMMLQIGVKELFQYLEQKGGDKRGKKRQN